MTLDPFAMLADAILARNEPWRRDAACRGLPTEWFYPPPNANADPRACDACADCPVRNECWAAGTHETYGMWAGRQAVKRRRQRPIKHGTPGGYNAHRRRDETPCASCREAHKADVAERDTRRNHHRLEAVR